MRLSDVLSKEQNIEFMQVDGFMDNKKLHFGKQRKITIGSIALNYFCNNCKNQRTFWSESDVFCLGVDDKTVSIDTSLKCNCGSNIQLWFLIESEKEIFGFAPKVRILKKSERLGDNFSSNFDVHGKQSVLLDKADQAFREGLGAGSMVYLRMIYEDVTKTIAINTNIPLINEKGKKLSFSRVLEEVDQKHKIIPKEFSDKKYKLFSELSEIIHGNTDEETSLKKYAPSRRLVVGILDTIKNNEEIRNALVLLEWEDKNEKEISGE